jgi:hypothetical protein
MGKSAMRLRILEQTIYGLKDQINDLLEAVTDLSQACNQEELEAAIDRVKAQAAETSRWDEDIRAGLWRRMEIFNPYYVEPGYPVLLSVKGEVIIGYYEPAPDNGRSWFSKETHGPVEPSYWIEMLATPEDEEKEESR